jgi:hypothetical protein
MKVVNKMDGNTKGISGLISGYDACSAEYANDSCREIKPALPFCDCGGCTMSRVMAGEQIIGNDFIRSLDL